MYTGFPSQATEYLEGKLDLNSYLVKHPAATFFMRVKGDAMVNTGIYPNDLLIVDRSLEPKNNAIVVAVVSGELTVKRLAIEDNQVFLLTENPEDKEIDFNIWGVVTKVIHDVLL